MGLEKILEKSKKYFLTSLLAGGVAFGCGGDSIKGPGNSIVSIINKPPETEIEEVKISDDRDENGNFLGSVTYNGTDENGKIEEFRFRINDSKNYKDWQVSDMIRNIDPVEGTIISNKFSQFFSLPEGSYTIEVKAIDNEGMEDPTPAKETFVIEREIKNPINSTINVDITPALGTQGGIRTTSDDIIREPIEVIENDGEVVSTYEGFTDSNGKVSFVDESSVDGMAGIKLVNDETQKPIENGMKVVYYDSEDSKIFTAVDPNEEFLPTMGVFSHNSIHTLSTHHKDGGILKIQTIDDEDEFKALYKWEKNLGINAGNYTIFEYEKTVNTDDHILEKGVSSSVVKLVKLFEGSWVAELFGVSDPFSVSNLAENLNPYNKDVESDRWDVYRMKEGHTWGEIRGGIEIVPSNVPNVEISKLTNHDGQVLVYFRGIDKETYDMPFGLPDKRDLTVLLGETENSDLNYSFTLEKDGELFSNSDIVMLETDELGNRSGNLFTSYNNLPNGDFDFTVWVEDEVENRSSDSASFQVDDKGDPLPIVTIDINDYNPEPKIGDFSVYANQGDILNRIVRSEITDIVNIDGKKAYVLESDVGTKQFLGYENGDILIYGVENTRGELYYRPPIVFGTNNMELRLGIPTEGYIELNGSGPENSIKFSAGSAVLSVGQSLGYTLSGKKYSFDNLLEFFYFYTEEFEDLKMETKQLDYMALKFGSIIGGSSISINGGTPLENQRLLIDSSYLAKPTTQTGSFLGVPDFSMISGKIFDSY